MIKLELSDNEMEVLVKLIDAAVRMGGINAISDAAKILNKLEMAKRGRVEGQ